MNILFLCWESESDPQLKALTRSRLPMTRSPQSRNVTESSSKTYVWSRCPRPGSSTPCTRILERAERGAEIVREKPLPWVPCHGDLHAGNVMVADDKSLTIVDWDDPLIAPRERDLMFIGAGVGRVWTTSDERAAFYCGYGPGTVDVDAIAYYRSERIIEDIALFSRRLLYAEQGGKDRALSLRFFLDQFRPNGVVDMGERSG